MPIAKDIIITITIGEAFSADIVDFIAHLPSTWDIDLLAATGRITNLLAGAEEAVIGTSEGRSRHTRSSNTRFYAGTNIIIGAIVISKTFDAAITVLNTK